MKKSHLCYHCKGTWDCLTSVEESAGWVHCKCLMAVIDELDPEPTIATGILQPQDGTGKFFCSSYCMHKVCNRVQSLSQMTDTKHVKEEHTCSHCKFTWLCQTGKPQPQGWTYCKCIVVFTGSDDNVVVACSTGLHQKSIGKMDFFCSTGCLEAEYADTDEDLPELEVEEASAGRTPVTSEGLIKNANEWTPVVSNPLLNQLFWPDPEMDSIAYEFIAKLSLPKKEDQKKK